MKIPLKLIKISEQKDSIRGAIRKSLIEIRIFDKSIEVECGNYQLPIVIRDIKVDCSVTKGYTSNPMHDGWGLKKDARIRLFKNQDYFKEGEFIYPVKQQWFSSHTQSGNEPVFVDSGEYPEAKGIYYHYGVDIGGAEGLTEVVASTDGVVVSGPSGWCSNKSEVCLKDSRNWFHKYSHLKKINPDIVMGKKVSAGQAIGLIGKEGNSGGWSHLHYDIRSLMPSGLYGSENAYPYLLEAFIRENKASLLAIARPHHFGTPGSSFYFDVSKSFSSNKITEIEWQSGEEKKKESQATFQFNEIGSRQVILKIKDSKGDVDYDFVDVQILDPTKKYPPTLHTSYHPTQKIQANQNVSFLARAFRGEEGELKWDFGDGIKETQNYKVITDAHADAYVRQMHSYKKSGLYLVKIIYKDKNGLSAENHLKVLVE